MEPRVGVAHWEGDKLTVYTPTGGIANCRHDIARDLGHCRRKGARDLPVHGRQLRQQESEPGCRSDRRDAGQAGRRAGEAGALAQGRFHRHARPLADHSILQSRRRRTTARCKAIQLRGYSGMGGYRKNSGAIGGIELYQCPNIETVIYPVYTNKTVSGNFRGPEFPQGYFGIQSHDGRRRLQAEDGSGRVRSEEHDAQGQRPGRTPITRWTNASTAARKLSNGRSAGVRSRAPMRVRSSAARACRSWRSAREWAAAARSCAWIRRASTTCTSASPMSARARKPPWA